jgi:hypothetical protein
VQQLGGEHALFDERVERTERPNVGFDQQACPGSDTHRRTDYQYANQGPVRVTFSGSDASAPSVLNMLFFFSSLHFFKATRIITAGHRELPGAWEFM